ncbi:MAG: phosphate regulon sensor histidine kinase PhoR, partial [Gammaproteobacteria bacterium]|nr:phosphate regulon sensor histidine kinase PhoR [Gammaproteobacteria bacterium]
RRKRKLTAYLKQFQLATRALPDATIVLDADLSVTWANSASARMLGVNWPDDVNRRVTNLIRVPALKNFLEAHDAADTVEFPSPVDDTVHLSVRLSPYGQGQSLLVARDVSQIHRVNTLKSDFVANVSHELRTPLTVFRGFLENLHEDRDQAPERWRPALEQMYSQCIRMHGLLEELLLLSRLESSDSLEALHPISLGTLLIEIHEEAEQLALDKQMVFNLSLDEDIVVKGSRPELYSAFSNLVFNAVRYSREGDTIDLRCYADDKGAHVEVEDTGIGIAKVHIPRLTERFYRVDKSRSRAGGGSGLGLAIVKHVTLRHGATLSIESEPNTGSLFRISFPPEMVCEDPAEVEPGGLREVG